MPYFVSIRSQKSLEECGFKVAGWGFCLPQGQKKAILKIDFNYPFFLVSEMAISIASLTLG